MAINYAEKYSTKVNEHFAKASVTQGAFNEDFDWEGSSTVKVYSVATAPLNDYKLTGSARYGTADELGSSAQTMTLSQDKAFTFTIDRRSYEDQMMVSEAGRALRRQVDEVVIPEVDRYRIAKLAEKAGTISTGDEDLSAYEAFLNGVTTLLDNKAPLAGSFAFVTPGFYKRIRLDDGFIKASDLAQNMLCSGQVGMIEGIPLIHVPSALFPVNVDFIIANRAAAVSPVKLCDYKIHDNPPGLNGWLCEGRIYYDAFVLDNKAKGIYVQKSV